jgi:hypothetical protein
LKRKMEEVGEVDGRTGRKDHRKEGLVGFCRRETRGMEGQISTSRKYKNLATTDH